MRKNLKLVAVSAAVMMSSAFLFNNCSKNGFQLSDTEGSTALASSEPRVSAVSFRSGPADYVNTNSIDFSYDISGDNISSVSAQCYLDQTLQADCSSPIDLSAKPDGDYTLTVAATSQNNMMLAQAKRSFRLDRRAPVVTINSAPSGTINVTSASIAFSVTDNFPGAVSYCSLDNAAFTVCTSPYALSNLAQGAHNVKIYAQDKASNKSGTQTISFSVNTAVAIPSVAISQMPAAFSNSAAASFSFSGASTGSTIASYQCSMDNSAFAACSSPQAYSSLAEGSHSFSVKSIDATGQSSAAANYSFAIDLTKPSTPLVNSNQMNPTKSTSLNLTFNSTDSSGVAKYECKLDAGTYAACVSPQTFSGLSSASHLFAVRATDKAGNVSAEGGYSIVVDAVAPVVTISSQPASSTQSTSASFAFSVSDALSGVNLVECQLDAQAYASCVSPQAYNNLAVGNHTFNLRGTDKAGNSSVQSYSWSIAAASTPTPPPASTPTPTPTPSSAFPITLSVAAMSAATGEISLNWTAYSGAASYKVFRGTTEIAKLYNPDYIDAGLAGLTSYTYSVTAYDSTGKALAQSNSASATTLSPVIVACAPAPTSSLVVNVKNTGAKGDGVTDDTAAIQAAINQVNGTGGTVLVPDGTYMINAQYQQGNSIGLFIPGPGNMTFQMTSGAVLKTIGNNNGGAYFTLRTNLASNVNIIGGTIVGDRDTHVGPGEWGMNLGIYGGSNIYVQGLISRDAFGDNFYLGTNNPSKVNFCSVVALNSRRQNMSIITANGVVIKNSVFANSNGPYETAGLDIEPDNSDTVNDVLVTNSHFIHNTGVGIGMTINPAFSNIFIQNITIDNNLVAYNGVLGGTTSGWQASVWADRLKGPIKITNNTIRNGRNDGVAFSAGTQNVTVTGNTIQNAGLYGVYIGDAGSTGNTIMNNTICGSKKGQINDTVGGNTITNNTTSATCP